jgi:hypothetical protein
MDFGPRFNEPPRCDWKASSKTLDRVDCKDGSVLLRVGVKMRAMVLAACFDEHANDDSEEAGKFGHVIVH